MEINAYNRSNVKSPTEKLELKEKGSGSKLDMSDFLNLLVSQMTNQDAMNPMDNTAFVAQLAQFSSLQAMSKLSEISAQSQATSLIGKTVVMANYNDKGEFVIKEGKVEKVTIHSGDTSVYVGGIAYKMSNLMEVKADAVVEQKPADNVKEPAKEPTQ